MIAVPHGSRSARITIKGPAQLGMDLFVCLFIIHFLCCPSQPQGDSGRLPMFTMSRVFFNENQSYSCFNTQRFLKFKCT